MPYMVVLGPCVICGALMSFNPERVPSVRVNGVREPICRVCVDRVNPLREEKGLEPIVVLEGAYEEVEVE